MECGCLFSATSNLMVTYFGNDISMVYQLLFFHHTIYPNTVTLLHNSNSLLSILYYYSQYKNSNPWINDRIHEIEYSLLSRSRQMIKKLTTKKERVRRKILFLFCVWIGKNEEVATNNLRIIFQFIGDITMFSPMSFNDISMLFYFLLNQK